MTNAAEDQLEQLRRRAERATRARRDAERILEGLSRQLFFSNEALRESEKALEETVNDRTQELLDANEKLSSLAAELQAARDSALEASDLKSRFLANMSHEIRTPLNAVIGLTSLLLETELSEEQREHLTTIQKSGDALLYVIGDILDFSKIEADQLTIDSAPFDPRCCVSECVELARARVDTARVSLQSHVADDVPALVIGDHGRVRQVLLNYLGNAAKFTEDGSIEVTVKWHVVDNDAGASRKGFFLEFLVSDTGIGIESKYFESLFDPFRQAGGSSAQNIAGTGLGLAICRRLAELMGGHVSVQSHVGKGSTFGFSVATRPARVSENPASTSGEARPSKPPSIPADRFPLRILAAEDNQVNQRVLSAMLQKLGYSATFVDNGLDALTAIAGGKYELAFLDLQMPKMTGSEVAIRISRLMPRDERPYMVALTAHAIQEMKERNLAAGMDEYATKPIRLNVLREVLQRAYLSRHSPNE